MCLALAMVGTFVCVLAYRRVFNVCRWLIFGFATNKSTKQEKKANQLSIGKTTKPPMDISFAKRYTTTLNVQEHNRYFVVNSLADATFAHHQLVERFSSFDG
jgi:hypothetical protein